MSDREANSQPPDSSPLARALAQRRVLVCVGAGGVGKTTVAASLALCKAVEGQGALVCTIDPARRLANSLGLNQLGNAETRIAPEQLASAGLPPSSPLFAMMLDMKRTWDEFIERHAPPSRKERILNNRFYRSLSSVLAGSQEYIAMEELWQLRMHREYRLIVLDTPPAAHAKDFLDAPNRVLDFLDNDAAKWLLGPALTAGKFGLHLFGSGSGYVAKTLAKLTGAETLEDLADFMLAMSSMNESFRQRARQVRALLTSDETAFVVVTTPQLERLEEAVDFHTELQQNHMAVAAVIVNRVTVAPSREDWKSASKLELPLRQKIEQTLGEDETMAEEDAQAIAKLKADCHPTPLVSVPKLVKDIHDLNGLWSLAQLLVPAGEAPGRTRESV
jgi:anion-transporting  ArsA/GET3 family ATPase